MDTSNLTLLLNNEILVVVTGNKAAVVKKSNPFASFELVLVYPAVIFFFFYNCIVPLGFLPKQIRVAFPWGKPAVTVALLF